MIEEKIEGSEEILNLLRDNARLCVADIAAMTRKSEEQVKTIIRSLEDDGTILKYAAIINPEKDGAAKKKVRAEIEIEVTPEREHGFDAFRCRCRHGQSHRQTGTYSKGYQIRCQGCICED